MPSDARCGSRGPPGDLHGPLGMNNAGSSPRGDSRGPPGDLHGTARQVTSCFFWKRLRTHHKGQTVSGRERERVATNTHHIVDPLGQDCSEQCRAMPGAIPGAPGRSARTTCRTQCRQQSPGRSPGAPGRSARHCPSNHQLLLLEARENAPQGEDNERERGREIRNKHTSYKHASIVDPIGQDHLP